jgi:SPP1 family predicted phage head-tail adaptor
MRAGTLRHRITIQSRGETRDADGGSAAAWTNFATSVPAEVLPLTGREFLAAGVMQDEVTDTITIRYMTGMLSSMRIVFDGWNYNITAILPDPTARAMLTILVKRGLSDG